jgi:hypothetical protein
MGIFAEHINIKDCIITILKKHPFEWFSIFGTVYSPFCNDPPLINKKVCNLNL